MADYRTLENKIKDIVGRPWTKDPKQVHHKQQQIQKKIIDEAPEMLKNKDLGIPDSVVEAAKTIAKQPTKVEINPDYKPRMDQEEELVGKQHKIDANKNGKIDADDFKKLRAKTLKEAPPTSSDPDFAAPRHPSSPSNPNEIKFKPEPKKPEQKKPEEKKPVPPLPPKRPSNLNTEGYSGTPKEPRVVFTGSPSHTAKKAEQYKARGYEVEKIKKGPSGIFGDNSEKHTYSMVHKSVKEEAKPDYLDFDKDGNEKESMKKALKDKKKVAKEEVVFSDEEIAKLEAISKDVNEAIPLGAIAGALRSFGSGAMKQLPKPPSFPQLPSPDKFAKPMDMFQRQKDTLNKGLAGDAFKNVRDRATDFIDKIKGNGAKNNALLGLQGVHDVTALATGKDPYTQAMQQSKPEDEVPQATTPDTPESPKAAPTEKKKINAKEEVVFSDEELQNLEVISKDIEESKGTFLRNLFRGGAKKADDVTPPAPSAPAQLPAPAAPKQLPAPKAAEPAAPPSTRAPETPSAPRAPETPAPAPKKGPDKTFGPDDIDIMPPARPQATSPRAAEPSGPSTTFKEPTKAPDIFATPKGQPPALRNRHLTRPKVTGKNKLPSVTKEPPKTRTREPDKTFGPDDIEIIPPTRKGGVPATPDSLKKPGVTIDQTPTPTIPKNRTPKLDQKGLRNPMSRLPDTMPPDLTQPEDPLAKRKPETDTRTDTRTDTPTSIPPRIPTPPITPPPVPPAPMPVPITPPPATTPQPKCKTCGPNIAYRTYGRVEPRVGAPSPTQVQDSYEPTKDEIREANLAAQIRDAKPSITGHIEVSVGDKKVKIPHRKAQDFLGSYHSKRTPAEKDAHEKAFRREIGG